MVVVGCVVDSEWCLLVVLLMVGGGCVVDGGSVGENFDRWLSFCVGFVRSLG